jgi:molecular chaperone DnaJ
VDDGVILRVAGEGEDAPRGGPPGDLQCLIRVEEHPLFRRSGDDPADLFVEVPVPISIALLGGEVEIPSLDGVETIRLDAGTAPGATVRVRGHGLPRFQRSGRGDLYVRVLYDVPKSPGRGLRKALEGLRAAETEEVGPQRRRFADAMKDHAKGRARRRGGVA